APPQSITGSLATHRPPVRADGHCLAARGSRALHVVAGDTAQQSDVIDRKDIRPVQIEYQKHLGCPATDPAHSRELRDELFVRQAGPVRGVDIATDEASGKVLEVLGLALRQ